ncbi:hypothetical protein [Psychromonas sp. CD1]|uniref:hypothetical protein n=1 Tax=Psychromonas sp. CD1 TaxID=1979839 RepID=UPI001C5E8C79|nr:hypothetical protein [Psychromonas sp. CD1]
MVITQNYLQGPVGLWLSPWGGYNKPLAIRVSHAKEFAFETVDGKFALSGPNYFTNFNSKIVNLIKNEHITSFKLMEWVMQDRTSQVASSHPTLMHLSR